MGGSVSVSRQSTPGGGKKWFDGVNEILFNPGGGEWAKAIVGFTFGLIFGMNLNVNSDIRQIHSVLLEVVSLLLAMAFILCVTGAWAYKRNWPRVSAVTGVLATASVVVLPPMISKILLEKISFSIMCTVYAICVVLNCVMSWWPSPKTPPPSTQDVIAQEEIGTSSRSQSDAGTEEDGTAGV